MTSNYNNKLKYLNSFFGNLEGNNNYVVVAQNNQYFLGNKEIKMYYNNEKISKLSFLSIIDEIEYFGFVKKDYLYICKSNIKNDNQTIVDIIDVGSYKKLSVCYGFDNYLYVCNYNYLVEIYNLKEETSEVQFELYLDTFPDYYNKMHSYNYTEVFKRVYSFEISNNQNSFLYDINSVDSGVCHILKSESYVLSGVQSYDNYSFLIYQKTIHYPIFPLSYYICSFVIFGYDWESGEKFFVNHHFGENNRPLIYTSRG